MAILTRDEKDYLETLGFGATVWGSPAQRPSLPRAELPPSTPAPSAMNDTEWLAFETQVKSCRACGLCESRSQVVFGAGNLHAPVMFVGEAPGEDEESDGVPFRGKSGELLDRMMGAMGLRREDVYVANVVKCRPPSNRNPEAGEIASCLPYLREQLAKVNPRIVVALGTFAAQNLLQTESELPQLRGQFHNLGAWTEGACATTRVMPTFHPAHVLRNPDLKKAVWDDLKLVMAELGLQKT